MKPNFSYKEPRNRPEGPGGTSLVYTDTLSGHSKKYVQKKVKELNQLHATYTIFSPAEVKNKMRLNAFLSNPNSALDHYHGLWDPATETYIKKNIPMTGTECKRRNRALSQTGLGYYWRRVTISTRKSQV